MKFSHTSYPLPNEVIKNVLQYLQTGEQKEPLIPRYLCEGFCLYAGIISLNMQEEDFSFYNDIDRDADIKKNLKQISKYKNKTDEELNNIIKKNNLKDIRNSLFHGNFEVIQEEGNNWFLLQPQRPHNPTDIAITIPYQEIYRTLGLKAVKVRNEYLAKPEHSQNERFKYMYKFFSLCFIEMAKFYSNKKSTNFQTKDFILDSYKILVQYLLTVETFLFDQNEIYPYLKSHPKMQEKVCLFRNSIAHANIGLEGNKFKYIDIDKRTNSSKEISLNSKEFTQEIINIQATALLEIIKTFDEELEIIKQSNPNLNENFVELFKSTHKHAQETAMGLLNKKEKEHNQEDENIKE